MRGHLLVLHWNLIRINLRVLVFGVLTCLNEQQALDRAGLGGGAVMSEGGEENLGRSWATAAIEMSLLY